MSPQESRPAMPAKSPILAAVGISLAIGLGTVIGTTDTATLADILTGKWLTRTFTETQQGHTVAIAALEQSVGNVTRDIDFVATRVTASIQRSEERTSDRLALLDTELAALKNKIAGLQSVRPGTPVASSEASDIVGLRTSLHDLSSAHNSAVAALTKRLDRIEVKVGLASDVPPASGPRVHKARQVAKVKKPATPAFENDAFPPNVRPEHGHLFNIKPLSRQDAQLRLTRLRD